MATSLRRLLTFVLLTDLLIGMIILFTTMNNPETEMENLMKTQTDNITNWKNQFNNNFPNATQDTSTIQLDKSYGDVRYAQGGVWGLMKGSIDDPYKNTQVIIDDRVPSGYQKWMTFGVLTFIAIIHIFLALEIIYLIWGKKYD